VKVATLDPFHDNENAIADRLHDDVTVLDALHIVKFGTAAASSKTSTATADARMIRSPGSAISCAPASNGSPTANTPACGQPSLLTTATSRVGKVSIWSPCGWTRPRRRLPGPAWWQLLY